MQLPKFEHLEPESLAEAVAMLAQHAGQAKPIAGGTEVLVSMKQGLVLPDYLVDLKGIAELDFLAEDDGGLRVGALTRLADVIRSPLVQQRWPVLAKAAAAVGAPPLQQMGTVGGNLCLNTRCFYFNQSSSWRKIRGACYKTGGDTCHVVQDGKRCLATYQGDVAPVLIALGATAKIAGKEGERLVPLGDLYTGKGKKPLTMEPGEVLVEVRLPAADSNTKGDYQKLRYRGSMDFPLVGVAVVLTGDGSRVCTDASVVLTGVGRGPLIVEEASQILQGREITDQVAAEAAEAAYQAAHPVNNVGSDAAYRRKMVRVLTRRAILNASGGV
jgi:4-hydroxybenzoyl-CoA reductase subunit beta